MMSCDIQSIKKRVDFIKLSKEGLSSPQEGLVLQVISNKEDTKHQLIRFGVTATKKIGNAVIRNKCKRKLRVLAKDVLLKYAKKNSYYVLIARNTTYNRNISLLKTDLLNALKETKYIKKI
ncbi:MAG: ribonuclease P protein component [Alphaproteobacteria bacterium]|nr:MAG: ribonuclease P protein component [Alphaproteobacteria bacterium]